MAFPKFELPQRDPIYDKDEIDAAMTAKSNIPPSWEEGEVKEEYPTREDWLLDKSFLKKHSGQDCNLVYSTKSKLPIAAIYLAPFSRHRAETRQILKSILDDMEADGY